MSATLYSSPSSNRHTAAAVGSPSACGGFEYSFRRLASVDDALHANLSCRGGRRAALRLTALRRRRLCGRTLLDLLWSLLLALVSVFGADQVVRMPWSSKLHGEGGMEESSRAGTASEGPSGYLPCEPAAFKKEFPSQWGVAFQSDAPTGCPVSEAAFCALQDGVPMRITNRRSGAEGTPFWESHAEQLPSSLGGHIALANGATLHILSPSIARTPMQPVAHNITALARWSLPPSTPTSLPRSVSSASIYLGAFVAVFLEIFSVASLAVVRCARDGRNDRGIAFVVVCGKNIHVYIYIYIYIYT